MVAGGKTLLAPAPWHYSIKGKFGAPRTVRYSFAEGGGHVALCKHYRNYIQENGLFKALRERMKQKPHLARLAGAPDVWGRSDLKFCREAKAAGIDRLLVNGGQSAKDTEAIKALGYLIGCYDNYEDAFEGDNGHMGDFKTDADAVVRANGELMKAWVTHGNPPKQFMKRCTALFEKVASTWIPRDLEKHPYNARFLDVTPACSLVECYSDRHGLTRSEDREARRRLAQYVGNNLNLVLGGEHGRWWGADLFDYWEGMQSGNPFYSWPAGYVGEKIPQTREEIGQRYLEWGLGEKHRYPLWELVFHDCVVSTWYWGDSTGHLRQAAPELGYKQDAFNVLYGTIPLYWNNREFSYRWDQPDTRERLLESYRNTCKLHEQIAFAEMVSHEFVTRDRAVQKSTFSDGTQVWVNFGAKPWKLAGGRPHRPVRSDRSDRSDQSYRPQYVLPEYGFYARGPRIEQFRVVGAGGVATCIRTPDYLYARGNAPGLVETEGGAGVTIRREGPDRLRVLPDGAGWVRLNVKALSGATAGATAGARPATGAAAGWRLAELDADGSPVRITGTAKVQGEMLLLPAPARPVLLLGPRALAGVSEVVFGGPAPIPAVKQGDPLAIRLRLVNHGGKDARRVPVTAYLGAIAPRNRLAAQSVDVPAGKSVPVTFILPTARCDGPTRFRFQAGDAKTVTFSKAGNITERVCPILPDWTLWDTHVDLTVEMGAVSRRNPVVEVPFDADAERAKAGRAGKSDPASVRVVCLDAPAGIPDAAAGGSLCEAQYVEGSPAERRLVWRIPGSFPAGATVRCRVLLDGQEQKRHQAPAAGSWRADTQTYDGPRYTVRFQEGAIRGLWSKDPNVHLLSSLGVSSKDTGWVEEVGEVQRFEVVQDGPVFTQVRVRKSLAGNHSYDKVYTFYPEHFTVATLSPERFGTLSRAYYAATCRIQDDRGNKAEVDGKGDAEEFSGRNPSPKWYATWAEGWGLSAVAVTPHDGIGYWDAGNMAGVGFSTGNKSPATVAYVLHGAAEPHLIAPDFAAEDQARLKAPVAVQR